MKYPEKQFHLLVSGLKELGKVIDLRTVNPSALHFIIYQQGSEGQTHNWIYSKDMQTVKGHALTDLSGWEKVVKSIPASFELYPIGCNDSHIETAVKKAIKLIND
jgi:hypothetical protein